VLDIAAKAMAIEIDDRALLDETLRWFRFSAREIPSTISWAQASRPGKKDKGELTADKRWALTWRRWRTRPAGPCTWTPAPRTTGTPVRGRDADCHDRCPAARHALIPGTPGRVRTSRRWAGAALGELRGRKARRGDLACRLTSEVSDQGFCRCCPARRGARVRAPGDHVFSPKDTDHERRP
jgi:hypothetical protein